jgi:hypothetical protein
MGLIIDDPKLFEEKFAMWDGGGSKTIEEKEKRVSRHRRGVPGPNPNP